VARIRSSKPEWWRKAKWCALPRDVRSTYKGIWEVMADDEGRFQADVRLIKGDVWPFDNDITMKKIEKWLGQLAGVIVTVGRKRLPAIVLYEVDGARYGFMPGFVKHQKISHPTPSRLPAPPESLLKDSGKAPEPLRPDGDGDVDRDGDKDLEKEKDARLLLPEQFRPDFDRLIKRVPNPTSWKAEILSTPEGLNGGAHKAPTWAQIGQAIRDYNANNGEEANLAHFRGYLRRSTAEPRGGSVRSAKKAPPGEFDYTPTKSAEDLKWQT
jgi:hypothetical protein